MNLLSYLLGSSAAVVNAGSSVLQRKANRAGGDRSLDVRLIIGLLHQPAWFAGLFGVIVGFLLQATALANGPLAAVQPLLALELPITLLLAARVFGGVLRIWDWVAAVGMAGGLVLLIVSLSPGQTHTQSVPVATWVLGLIASYGLIAVLVGYGARTRGDHRAAVLGVATGVGFGVTAALMSAMAAAFGGGIGAVLTTWQTYLMIASGAGSMFLLQSALQAGRLVAAQPGITLADPVVAISWGVFAFGEPVRTGGWLFGAAAGGLAMCGFAFLLSRSPIVHRVAAAPALAPPGPRRQHHIVT
ncbi:MAG: DMT family transporter [Mycobacteriales bacterium]